jgi:serine/threonine protein kinase
MWKLPDEVHEGEVLAGRYRIEKFLCAGGMGALVAARHLLLGERVAIKFMLAEAENTEAVARFVQEARSARRIQNEHVVRVLDVAELASGMPYIVMEYLEGSDLAALLGKSGPLSIDDAVDHVLEACEAFAEAHDLGIVHRDVKPANLFLARQSGLAPRIIKVLDFGISKTTSLAPGTLDATESATAHAGTLPKTILGSPFYMSPEQMESARDVDRRTDIWALGVTLFELVTGKLPYTGSTLIQVYSKMVTEGRPAWRDLLLGFPAGLESVLAKCIARDREARYPSIADLAPELAPFGSSRALESSQRIAWRLARRQVDERNTPPSVAPTTPGDTLRASDKTPTGNRLPARLPRKGRFGSLASIVVALLTGAALTCLARRPPSPPVVSAAAPEPAQVEAPKTTSPTLVVASAQPPNDPPKPKQTSDRSAAVPLTRAASTHPSVTSAPSSRVEPTPGQERTDAGGAKPASSSRFDIKQMLEDRK